MYHLDMNTGKVEECSLQKQNNECFCVNFLNTESYKQYSTEEEALRNKHLLFKNRFNGFGLWNSYSESKHLKKLKDFETNLYSFSDRYLHKFANKNRANHSILSIIIEKRIHASRRKNSYRNDTAKILEAYLNSRFYKNLAFKIMPGSLGTATNFNQADVQKDTLAMTLSATDFGKIVQYDFWQIKNGEERPEFIQKELDDFINRRRVKEQSVKNNSYREERVYQKRINGKNTHLKYGEAYWGTVWERKVRNDFALDNPSLIVYEVEGKFRNNDAPWQLGIVDGAISDRSDGVPNGILEIKTSKTGKSWKNGIPQKYRAQALYYLHITGFEKAYVRVLINERKTKDYVLHINDEISVGSGQTVAEYIDNRLIPFLKSI